MTEPFKTLYLCTLERCKKLQSALDASKTIKKIFGKKLTALENQDEKDILAELVKYINDKELQICMLKEEKK